VVSNFEGVGAPRGEGGMEVVSAEGPQGTRQGGPRCSTPNGIRTRVAALKGRCPGPLDDGGQR